MSLSRRSRLETHTPLHRGKPLERGAPMRRGEALKATQWGTRPKVKTPGWRDEYLPDWMSAPDAPKLTAYEKALAAFVRTLPCCVCGRVARVGSLNQASHVALSADQKGMGMKVPHVQVVSHCPGLDGCHSQWDQRRGFCAGWSKDERYAMAATWLDGLQLAITPEDRNGAAELERWGLGKVIGDGTPTGFAWLPGHLVEAGINALAAAGAGVLDGTGRSS